MDAIILAAGRGQRLRPLSDTLPKPLMQVAGLSLIECHLIRLAQAGITRAIINLHHLGDLIQAKLGTGKRYGLEIDYSVETGEALETAGGIIQALPLIRSDKFVMVSADILCDFPFANLRQHALKQAQQHRSRQKPDQFLGHLILVDNPAHHPQGDFALQGMKIMPSTSANDNVNVDIKAKSKRKRLTFSGIATFDKQLFNHAAQGRQALRPILEAAIKNQQLSGEYFQGIWSDIGTPERLKAANQSASIGAYIDSIKQSTS